MTTNSMDVLIIGGGAAGLSAALTLGRSRRRVLVVDAGEPRNRFAAHMHGVLGQEGVPPGELLARGRAEASAYGVEFAAGAVTSVEEVTGGLRVTADDGAAWTTRAVVLATGIRDELPDLPGLAERWGSSVLHCPYCHGWEVRDTRLGVLATTPFSLHQAELVRQWSERVTVFAGAIGGFPAEAEARLRARGVVIERSPVVGIDGPGVGIDGVRLADGRTVPIEALFTVAGAQPLDGCVAGLGLTRNETPFGAFLAVDGAGATSHPRVWGVGNVVQPMASVPMAIGAAAFTAATVNAALVSWDFDEAVAPRR